MQETQARFLGQEDPLEEEMSTHSSILAWEIPWTEEPGGLQSTGSQRVRHDWVTEQQPEKGSGQRNVLLASILGWPGGSCSSPIILTFRGAHSRHIPGLRRGEKHSFSWAVFPSWTLLVFYTIISQTIFCITLFIATWDIKSILCLTPRESQHVSTLTAVCSSAVQKKPPLALF